MSGWRNGKWMWIAALALAAAPAAWGQQAANRPAATQAKTLPAAAAQRPDAKGQYAEPEKPEAAPPAKPKNVVDEQNELLLQLATELKAEVDKTTANVLSLQVIRKAAEIEQLTQTAQQQVRASLAAQ